VTQIEAMIKLLSDGQWHHMRDLHAIAWRYSSVLHVMKKRGMDHERREDRDTGAQWYRLKPKSEVGGSSADNSSVAPRPEGGASHPVATGTSTRQGSAPSPSDFVVQVSSPSVALSPRRLVAPSRSPVVVALPQLELDLA
jgi:hypothetical protein